MPQFSDQSVIADLILRQEPDEEEDGKDDEGDGKDDDDDDRDDRGYSEKEIDQTKATPGAHAFNFQYPFRGAF